MRWPLVWRSAYENKQWELQQVCAARDAAETRARDAEAKAREAHHKLMLFFRTADVQLLTKKAKDNPEVLERGVAEMVKGLREWVETSR